MGDSHTDNPFEEFSSTLDNKLMETKEPVEVAMQRTKKWHIKRLGMFTGSKIPDLMKEGRGAVEFGAAAMTYIETRVSERMLDIEQIDTYIERLEGSGSRATGWGVDHEAWARGEFARMMKFDIKETDFIAHPDYEYFGGSSDGKIVQENNIIEIKNPYDPAKHIANAEMTRGDGYPVKGDYYGQMQANIEIAGADGCYFISGDIRSILPIVWIYVPRDEEYIEKMLGKLKKADAYVRAKVNYLLGIEN